MTTGNVNILIICLGTLSSGEAAIVSSCFSNVRKKSIRLHAIVSNLVKKYFDEICDTTVVLNEDNGKLQNVLLFNKYVSEIKPEFFVCADMATMNHSFSWSGIDIECLKQYGIKIAAMDQYSSSAKCQIWDWLGSNPTVVAKNDLIQADILIRPVPLNRPESDRGNILYCPLFPESIGDVECNTLNTRCHVGAFKKVFIANSPWEYNDVSPRQSNAVKRLREWLPEILYHYLAATRIPIDITHVGPRRWGREEFHSDVRYQHIHSMKSDDYQRTLRETDIFITTNITSISLSSALRYGKPCFLLYNPKPIDFRKLKPIMASMPEWYQAMAKEVCHVGAFRMFPWGWNNYLRNIVNDNHYMELIIQCPIFEPKKCINVLHRVLSNVSSVDELRASSLDYYTEVSSIPSLSEKLLPWLKKVEA